MHPRTSAVLGQSDGEHVPIKKNLGLIPAVLHLDDGLNTDMVLAPRGGRMKMGRGINVIITPGVINGEHTAACYHQKVTLVRVDDMAGKDYSL